MMYTITMYIAIVYICTFNQWEPGLLACIYSLRISVLIPKITIYSHEQDSTEIKHVYAIYVRGLNKP